MSDPVNSPDHYRWLPVEVIEITERLGFCMGNVVKYVLRADHKGRPLEDLRKAAWYLNREIARREREALATSATIAPSGQRLRQAPRATDPVLDRLARPTCGDVCLHTGIHQTEAGTEKWYGRNPFYDPPSADLLAAFNTPDDARYDEQHVRGTE